MTHTFNNVQPLPRRQTVRVPQPTQDPSCNQIAECTRDQGPRVKDGHAQVQLRLGVPLGQVEQHAREEGRLDHAEDEPARDDLSKTLDQRGQGRHGPPEHGEETQVERRAAHVVEQHVGRHLSEDVTNKEDGEPELVLRVAEIEVRLEALEPGCGIIVAVTTCNFVSC